MKRMKIAHMPKDMAKGFWDLKDITGVEVDKLHLAALHHGLMHLKINLEKIKSNPLIQYRHGKPANKS